MPININYISDYESIDIHAYLHKMRVLNAPRFRVNVYTYMVEAQFKVMCR